MYNNAIVVCGASFFVLLTYISYDTYNDTSSVLFTTVLFIKKNAYDYHCTCTDY
jgi:hypothetical protein